MVAALFITACLQSHQDEWAKIPKFGPENALSDYVVAAKLSVPYWPDKGSNAYKLAPAPVANKILALIDSGNKKRAFDNRPPSLSLLYVYLAKLKGLLRFGLFQAEHDLHGNHKTEGMHWLTSLGTYSRNTVKRDTITYYIAFAMRTVWAKAVVNDKNYLSQSGRKRFALELRSIHDSPDQLAAAVRTDYRAYLAFADEQAKNWKAMGDKDEEEAKAMSDFLNHFPAGREAVRKGYEEFFEAQAKGFSRPESKWETPMKPDSGTDSGLFVKLGRESTPATRKYFLGMFKWMAAVETLQVDVGPTTLGTTLLKERKKLLAIADDLDR